MLSLNEMWLLLEKNMDIKPSRLRQIFDYYEKYGIETSFREFSFNREKISLSELSKWVQGKIDTKALLLTERNIKGRKLGLQLKFHGLTNELNGNIGVVKVNSFNSKYLATVCLHESLHLIGLPHCKNEECLMSLQYRNLQDTTTLCNSCRRWLNEKREGKN